MFTRLLKDGALQIVQVLSYSNKKRIARIYEPKATVPHSVLQEIEPNRFLDPVNDRVYLLTNTGMIGV